MCVQYSKLPTQEAGAELKQTCQKDDKNKSTKWKKMKKVAIQICHFLFGDNTRIEGAGFNPYTLYMVEPAAYSAYALHGVGYI